MKKPVKNNQFPGKKLDIHRETLRRLTRAELESIRGGEELNGTRTTLDDEI